MDLLFLLCGIAGISISTISILLFSTREHRLEKRRTLSELAARNPSTLREFRIILWVCGTLISIMMYGLVLPNLSAAIYMTIFYTIIIFCELSLAIIPAHNDTFSGKIHNFLAFGMGFGMLFLALCLARVLTGSYSIAGYTVSGLMFVLGMLGVIYYDRFIFFQLPFIFLSHVSLLIASLAVFN